VRLPILTIERVGPFFWVSLGPREARAFGVPVVQHFDGVAVEDGDDGTGEVCRDSGAGEHAPEGEHGATCYQASRAVKRSRYQLF
jgi:hypothetical protein